MALGPLQQHFRRVGWLSRRDAGWRQLGKRGALPTVLLLAVSVRAWHALGGGFPRNDGGLFYVMAGEIQANGLLLPATTGYNNGDLPFVYSPLALYAAAVFEWITPASLADTFLLLPLVGACFVVWAFWRLACVVLRHDWMALTATLAFALVPRSFVWLVMGGGLPRGFALGFALLAITEAYRLAYDRERDAFSRRRSVILLGVFAGLTALTHLETAAFLALSCLVLAVLQPCRLREFTIAGALATVLAAPWAVLVIARHGIEPFLASLNHGGRLLDRQDFSVVWVIDTLREPVSTGEPFFPLVGALGVVGALLAIGRGRWFLPLWWLMILVTGMRAYPTFAAIPTALLAASAVCEGIVPVLRDSVARGGLRRSVTAGCAAIAALMLLVNGALVRDTGQAVFLRSLPEADREAMAWIETNTASEASFAVIPVSPWFSDYVSEWFPALAQRHSIATPQGYEWMEGAFGEQERRHAALLDCGRRRYLCLEPALGETEHTHVYVPSTCCGSLKDSLRTAEPYTVVYDEHGVLVAEAVNDRTRLIE